MMPFVCPTEHFTTSKPQRYVVRKCRLADFEALKLLKGRTGGSNHSSYRRH